MKTRRFSILSLAASGLALVTALLAASCVVDDKTTATPPGETDTVVRPVYGRFQVTLVEETAFDDAYASVLGRVTTGTTPSTLQWDTATVSGACKLLIPRAPFCETPCGSGAACVADGVCRVYPAGLNVGTVTMTGVKTTTGATSFTMQPVFSNYQPVGITLDYPPFTEGAEVSVAIAHDSVGSFALKAKGIAPLNALYDSVVFADNQPVTLTWTPPSAGAAGNSTVSARFDISHHGGVKGVIECEAADNGSLTVAAGLVTQLKGLGISGFPTVELSRHSASPARTDMSLELRIESTVTRPISIPGIVSCSGDEDCPNGQTCQQDLKCQ